jgi:alkane 1-monooxygenase
MRPQYLLSLLLPLVAIAGNLGYAWPGAGIVLALVAYPLLDLLLGESKAPPPTAASPHFFDAILYAHVALQFAAVGSLLWLASGTGALTLELALATGSTGISSGISGIVVAHELVHRPRRWERALARALLWSVSYLHFETEHVHGHHRTVGTDADPASAPAAMGLWWFVLRTVPGQFASAWRIAAQRSGSGWRHTAAAGLLVSVATLAAIGALLGPVAAALFAAQSLVAIELLEYVNYVRHWGLRRQPGERVAAHHSWQSDARLSRWVLVELTRHPEHHLTASRPYHQLRSLPDAPQLPTGYFGCFWLALLPPVWKRVMMPRLP